MSEIRKEHLERAAYIYARQSTMAQVHHNPQSQRCQYGLEEHARQLGFRDVRVIDEDLGCSGSGHVTRHGFEDLLAAVCQGQVGAVFAAEASRLARNGHEWHRLLEFCAIVDTLIIDHDGVYDPKQINDRLLLGLKGTISEMEVTAFRQRSQEAVRQMARRGEYYVRIPEGYVHRGAGRLEKDPDEQVRRAIELVLAKFVALGSARQVSLWLRQEGIRLPKRLSPIGEAVEFVPATPWRVTRLVKEPAYAGAYAHGRSRQRVVLEEGRKRRRKEKRPRPEQWEVLILDHHPGYISWPEYLKNQERLAQNRNALGAAVLGAPRGGKGLLAGLVRCGHCGRKMRVRYSGRRRTTVVYYYCVAAEQEQVGKQLCSIFGGVTVEKAVVEATLEALSPLRLEAVRQATDRLQAHRREKRQQVALELERARYEAERCARQYHTVEPENRLVARTLESRWNEALERVRTLEGEYAELVRVQEVISPEEHEQLRRLAVDLPRVWHHPSAPFDLKKRLLRTVIREVVVYVEQRTLRVLLHWQGGQHTELELRKRRPGEHRYASPPETVTLLRQLAQRMSDKQVAAQLNRLGIKTAKGHTWTRIRVGNFRKIHNIRNYCPEEQQARGELTLEETAARLGVSYSTVQRLIRRGQLPARQLCPKGPWIVLATDVEMFRTKAHGAGNARAGASSPPSTQQTLAFPEDT
jgi:DNA invertase Pin-like site-specific DNA recombinase